jgi:hypothetical protein
MRWVLWWLAGSCVGVGRKRGLRHSYTWRKRQQGAGAQGSAHRGVGHDGGGDQSSSDKAAPHGRPLHKWGECGEGRLAQETGVARGGLPRWGGGGFGLRRSECRGIYILRGHCDRHHPGWPMGCQRRLTLPLTSGPHTSVEKNLRDTKTGFQCKKNR